MIRILYLGDIVGSSGRRVIKQQLARLKQQYHIDVTIANAENAAHGKGITKKIYYQLCDMGIDYFSMGNHTFAKKDIYDLLPNIHNMVVPANMGEEIGVHTICFECKGKKIALSNLLTEVFMYGVTQSPFEIMNEILNQENCDIHIVDIHGEATSEKIAFLYAFKDKLSLIVGTHTHVQTADEKIVDGCGYITDLGMCGTYHSILGRDIDEILDRFLGQEKRPYKIAEGQAILHGIVVEIDENTNRCHSIQRIQIMEE